MKRWLFVLLLIAAAGQALAADKDKVANASRPNFLFVITDDQSWAHTSYAGYSYVKTPTFDRIAREGVYFRNAFVSSPSCTESRSSILSGRHFWQTGPGAMLWGTYPSELPNFIHQLGANGYQTAYTGKGWGPGIQKPGDLPTGTEFRKHAVRTEWKDGYEGVKNYVGDFEDFLAQRNEAQPFFFWLGLFEPHREYFQKDIKRFSNDSPADQWPPFMPSTGRAWKQMTRYLEEIEYADAEVARFLKLLEKKKLLDNTVIIYTSDNGMPFAGAKANLYRYGVQVPLAVMWKGHHLEVPEPQQKDRDELVSLTDLAPTVLELAAAPALPGMTGQSLLPLLNLDRPVPKPWQPRDYLLTGFERHVPDARPDFSTYPARGIITREAFYIRNYKPERWPQGNPSEDETRDYQDASIEHLLSYKGKKIEPFFSELLNKRPAEELYGWEDAPGPRFNRAGQPQYAALQKSLDDKLQQALREAGDPGLADRDYFFKTYGQGGDPRPWAKKQLDPLLPE